MGESGCGKTSFLQAGVVPKLTEPEADYCVVYVRFSDRPPLNAIQDDLSKQLHIAKDQLNSTDLVLLQTAVAAIDKPLILFFDQFEQFFVHTSRKPDRQPFIQALTDWYHSDLPVRVLVCMRGDMVDRLVELHQALGYALSPQELFRLEKFSPEEATKVLQVIAETEKLRFEESFVRELAERELADREDGAISPVDLQILGWMIERQNADELRAFNQQAFQKFGGVEGLMTRFLEKTLEARVIKSQRETAVKVLLALTDLDRNVRAGALNLTELQDRLKDTVKPDEVAEAVRWLVRGDVRLVTPEETTYELAHERLIPAVRKVAGKELTEAQKANELLDRRVNEWLVNNRSPRYLFNLPELRIIKRQEIHLIWGIQRRSKENLLQQSKKRLYQQLGGAFLVLLLVGIWILYLYSPWGQVWQIRQNLAELSNRIGGQAEAATTFPRSSIEDAPFIGNENAAGEAVIAFTKDGHWVEASKILKDKIRSPYRKIRVLSSIASVYGQMGKENLAQEFLEQAFEVYKEINGRFYQAGALDSIVTTATAIDNKDYTQVLLQKTLEIINGLDANVQAWVLPSIATAYGYMGNQNYAQVLFQRSLKTIGDLNDSDAQARALNSVSKATKKLINANKIDINHAKDLLQQVLKITTAATYLRGELIGVHPISTDPLNITSTDTSTEVYESPNIRAKVLESVVVTIGHLNDIESAQRLLQKILEFIKKLDVNSQALVLPSVAESYRNLGDRNYAQELLNQSLEITRTKNNSLYVQVIGLSSVAVADGKLGNKSRVRNLLLQAITLTGNINNPDIQALALASITEAIGQLSKENQSQELLKQVLESAKDVNGSIFHEQVLVDIAETYAKLNRWRQARYTVDQCSTNLCKVDGLAAVLTVWAEQQHPELAEVEEE